MLVASRPTLPAALVESARRHPGAWSLATQRGALPDSKVFLTNEFLRYKVRLRLDRAAHPRMIGSYRILFYSPPRPRPPCWPAGGPAENATAVSTPIMGVCSGARRGRARVPQL